MKNPFNIMYGMIPDSLVNRNDAFDKIISSFTDENVVASTYVITGIRGSGKTVLLRSIANELKKYPNWIVINLNPQSDFVSSLSEKLYEEIKRNKIAFNWSIDVSLPNITFHISKSKETLSAENAIPHLLDVLKKKNKRILLLIDEVNQTKYLKYFANMYQSLIGDEYPLFLLMTGLFENVDSLISSKATSFLARSPKIVLYPLNLSAISAMYQKELNASREDADELAKLSQGYAFAYQVIGKICFENKKTKIDDSLLSLIDNYLAEHGYNVIWRGMTSVEKKICLAIAKSKDDLTSEIMQLTQLKTTNFNNYRARMIYKGYLVSLGYGKLGFALPRFKEYILLNENFI